MTQPVTTIESLGAIADATLARERLLAELASWFGLLALVLACIGLYGTMSFEVARRTNEIGTRLALGATRAQIVGSLMIEFGTPVALGAAAGIALAVSRPLSRFLFGLDATDPTTIGARRARPPPCRGSYRLPACAPREWDGSVDRAQS